MARFEAPIHQKKRKKEKLGLRLYIALFLLSLIMLVYVSTEDARAMQRVALIWFTLNLGWSSYERWKKLKRKPLFLEIDQNHINWTTTSGIHPQDVTWDEIRWIKNEKDEAIMISRASSFTIGFSLDQFLATDRETIKNLIVQYAEEKQIKLVNFSLPAPELA